MNDDFTQELISELSQVSPSKIVSRGRELVRRCPYCGDSKNPDHHHFYIELNSPFPFYCQICKTSGWMTKEVLRDLDSDSNLDVTTFVERNLKRFKKENKIANTRFRSDNLFSRRYHSLPITDLDELSNGELRKLRYLTERMNLDIDDLGYLSSLNLVLSMKKFFRENEVEYVTESDPDLVRNLSKYYLGYASKTGSSIFMRDTRPDTKQRHWLYNMEYNTNSIETFYTISGDLDLTVSRPCLHMAEGFFSLLGVYEKLGRPSGSDQIFASPIGKGYNRIVSFLSNLGYLDMDIHFYSDSDVDINFYKRLIRSNKILRYNRGTFTLHYNKHEDDFGYPIDKIKFDSKRIKI